ncbi:MAG: DUF2283 domain-containing protein [Desulfohalobiaceae bacterium]
MRFQYFHETDMLYIKLAGGTSTESEEVAQGIVLDFDAQNKVIGIEIEDASKYTDLSSFEVLSLPIVSFMFSEREPLKA